MYDEIFPFLGRSHLYLRFNRRRAGRRGKTTQRQRHNRHCNRCPANEDRLPWPVKFIPFLTSNSHATCCQKSKSTIRKLEFCRVERLIISLIRFWPICSICLCWLLEDCRGVFRTVLFRLLPPVLCWPLSPFKPWYSAYCGNLVFLHVWPGSMLVWSISSNPNQASQEVINITAYMSDSWPFAQIWLDVNLKSPGSVDALLSAYFPCFFNPSHWFETSSLGISKLRWHH